MNTKPSLLDRKPDMRLVLMAGWTCLMILYLYCDFISLFRPGQLRDMMEGKMGFMEVSQGSLLVASLLMIIPTLMILVSALTPARANRLVNLVAAALYLLVNIGNLVGETWGYYYLFGILEAVLVVLIFVLALRWPRQET